MSETDLRASLSLLKEAEFIYEQSLYPVAEYTFKHPLTQEVAMRSQLQELRRCTHAAVARALEEAHADRLDEKAALLAHHYAESGETLVAARWHRRAAEWAGITNATEGLRHWERVRSLVRTLPQTSETSQLGASACLGTLGVGWRLGTPTAEAAGIFEEGRRLAEESGDLRTLAALNGVYACVLGLVGGASDEYVRYSREATLLAEQTNDQGLQLAERSFLAFACLFAGRLAEGIEACDSAFRRLPADPALGAEFTGYSPFLGILNGQSVDALPARASQRSHSGVRASGASGAGTRRQRGAHLVAANTHRDGHLLRRRGRRPRPRPLCAGDEQKIRHPASTHGRTPCAGDRASAQLRVG